MKNSVEQFNALEGKEVGREDLWELAALAEKENQGEVFGKINKLLNKFTDKSFIVHLTSKVKWVPQKGLGCPGTDCGCGNGLGCPGDNCSCANKEQQAANGLGAARHSGLAKEALTDCGRLKPGYVYRKGGVIEKLEKKKAEPKPKAKKKEKQPRPSVPQPAQAPTEEPKENKPETKTVKVNASDLDVERYLKKAEALEVSIKKNTDKRNELFKQQSQEKDRSKNVNIYEERQKLYDLIELEQAQLSHLANVVVALKNGGEIKDVTDKKGKVHKEVADFTKIDSTNIEFDEENIIGAEIPPYIPLLDQKALERRGFVFDSIRINEDSYLTATKSHNENGASYVILTLDQLVLTSDYYLKMTKALYKQRSEESNQRSEENWDKISDERKERHYNQRNQKGLYESMPAKVKKTITFEKWEKLSWQEKEKEHKFFRRTGVKRIKSKLNDTQMWVSMHQMYERFVNPDATPPKPRYANPEVFAYWAKFREMLKYKMLDIEIQRGDYAESRKKGLETSFGDSGTNDQLLKKHGILVKRQNGDKINPDEIAQIEDAWLAIEKVFGGLGKWARNFGLKISHTGNKLIYARKAVGVYAPYFRAVGVSSKYGDIGFANVMAHELGHFLDHQIGVKSGKRYESDNYESTAGELAGIFRKNMNGIDTITSAYTLSTKECLARAMEQYFAMETYGKDVRDFYTEMEGPTEGIKYSEAENHVEAKRFYEKVVPHIKKFIKEVADTQPQKDKGLGAPKGKTYKVAEIEIGLAAAKHAGTAFIALNNCGRLKPGYRFKKGGEIVKVEKPKSKTKSEPKRPTPKKKGTAAVDKPKKDTKETETEKIIDTIHQVAKLSLSDMQEFKRSKNKYRLGQMWSVSFDYHGAIELAMTIDKDWPLSKLEKLHASLEDVNYHELGRHIWDLMLHIKGVSPKDRKSAMGLGNPIVLDGGVPYTHQPIPGQPAENRDAAGTVLDIQVNNPQTIDPAPAKPKVLANTHKTKSKKVLTSRDLMGMNFESLEFDGKWNDFMQNPAKNMRLAIFGAPKNGKTSGATTLANYLTKFGKVLYNFVDQGFNKSTKDIWRLAGLSDNPNAFPSDIDNLDELEKEIATGGYDFVFIDMINDYIDKTGISPQEFKDRFIKKYPNISFILVFEVTKAGNFKGDQKWTHIVDAIVKVEDFAMHNKGRYGMGDYIVWEEGLKKQNPKKYDELMGGVDSVTISGQPVELV